MGVEKKDTEDKKSEGKLIENEWMIRPCDFYDEEYKDCTSIKARFNQYFIFGKTLDCNQWKRDSYNCYRWTEDKDLKSAKELIESEKRRRAQRLQAHYNNDIWERRKAPPDDWNKPLPKDMQDKYENSYLNIKAKEMKGEIPPQPDVEGSCFLM